MLSYDAQTDSFLPSIVGAFGVKIADASSRYEGGLAVDLSSPEDPSGFGVAKSLSGK